MFASSACTGRSSVLFWFIIRSIQTKNFETYWIEKSFFSLILYWRYKLVVKILIGFRTKSDLSVEVWWKEHVMICYLNYFLFLNWYGDKKYNMKFQVTCCSIPCVSILKMLVTCSITKVTFTYELQLKRVLTHNTICFST